MPKDGKDNEDWIALAQRAGGIKQAADEVGIPRHTLSNRIARQAIAGGQRGGIDAGIAEEKMRADLVAMRSEVRRLRRGAAEDGAAARMAAEFLASPMPVPDWVGEARSTRRHRPSVPVLMLGDQHLGEVVMPGQAYGNQYDTQIGIARQMRVVDRTIDLCFEHMTNPNYPGIVVPLMGDTVTGDIHDELKVTNDEPLLQSVLTASGLMCTSLRKLADRFGKVYAPAVAGNHGRTTRRVEAKDFTYKNFDWLIYKMMQSELRHDKRIVVSFNESNTNRFDVFGHRFLQMHGHDLGVKGGDALIGALGPIMRGRMKVAAQQFALGQDFDTLLIGHWHQRIALPGLQVNNTLKGYDEFAANILRAKPSPPSQSLFFVHPEIGVTAEWQVFAENPPAPSGRPEWCSWSSV